MAEDKNRWGAVLYLLMNVGVPLNVGNFFTSSGSITFSRRTALWSLARHCAFYLQVVGLADAAVNKMRYHVSFYGTGET